MRFNTHQVFLLMSGWSPCICPSPFLCRKLLSHGRRSGSGCGDRGTWPWPGGGCIRLICHWRIYNIFPLRILYFWIIIYMKINNIQGIYKFVLQSCTNMKWGAVCVNSARTVLWGVWGVIPISTRQPHRLGLFIALWTLVCLESVHILEGIFKVHRHILMYKV